MAKRLEDLDHLADSSDVSGVTDFTDCHPLSFAGQDFLGEITSEFCEEGRRLTGEYFLRNLREYGNRIVKSRGANAHIRVLAVDVVKYCNRALRSIDKAPGRQAQKLVDEAIRATYIALESASRVQPIFEKPYVRAGEVSKRRGAKAAHETNSRRKLDNSRRNEELIRRAKGLIWDGYATPRTISTYMVEQDSSSGLKVDQIRRILRKAGVR